MRILTLLVFWSLTGQCLGETIVPPPGLQPGDQYRLVITTHLLSPASSPDIEFYNEIVNQDVDKSNPALAHLDWRAVVSTSTVDARDNTGTNWIFNQINNLPEVPIYRTDGVLAADHGLGFFFNTERLPVSLAVGADGKEVPISLIEGGVDVWTGTNANGKAFVVERPFDEDFSLGNERVSFGLAHRTALRFHAGISHDTNFPRHLYAMSPVLTVVPEPSGSSLCFLFIVIGLSCRNRR